jgi:hypothetical protein
MRYILRSNRLLLALAPFPAGLEQRNVVLLLVRMLQNLLDIEVDSEAWTVGKVNVTIYHLNTIRHNLLFPRLVELVEDLVDKKVRDGGVLLRAGG